MYIQGVATRRVKSVLESLCGFKVSAMEVSRAAKQLDSVLDAWRERSLGVTPFVQLDALWCKVRHGGIVEDAAVLVAAPRCQDSCHVYLVFTNFAARSFRFFQSSTIT